MQQYLYFHQDAELGDMPCTTAIHCQLISSQGGGTVSTVIAMLFRRRSAIRRSQRCASYIFFSILLP